MCSGPSPAAPPPSAPPPAAPGVPSPAPRPPALRPPSTVQMQYHYYDEANVASKIKLGRQERFYLKDGLQCRVAGPTAEGAAVAVQDRDPVSGGEGAEVGAGPLPGDGRHLRNVLPSKHQYKQPVLHCTTCLHCQVW